MTTRSDMREWARVNSPKLYELLVDTITDQTKKEGTIITRPEYADALDLIAEDPNNFYTSDISDDIVKSVSTSDVTAL